MMKKNIRVMIFAIGLFIFLGCNNKDETVIERHDEIPNYVKDNHNIPKTDSLVNRAINQGDIKAYDDVSGNFILAANYKGLLYYSMIMANKYNAPKAHYHIFVILLSSSPKQSLNSLDEKTRNLALYHLAKSHELGFEGAKYSISESLGETGVIKHSSYYIAAFSK